MNFVFLMDPLHTVIMEKDTSFILMLGAHRKGHKVYACHNGGLTQKNGKLHFTCTEVTPQQVAEQPFIQHEMATLTEDSIDAVFIRNDPPFDAQYLFNTWLLDLLPERILVMNSPNGIRTTNEKIWVTQFSSLIPRTLITRNKADILAFLSEEKEIVTKPINGYGGQGIFRIREGDTNIGVIIETLTHNGAQDIILQQCLPEASQGDKRILLLNGDPLGAVLRVHAKDEHRNNFFAGGKPMPAEITKRDEAIIQILKPHLQKLGLHFVGIDVIGDHLIEVNVTSPTCLQEINRLNNGRLEDTVIDFVTRHKPRGSA